MKRTILLALAACLICGCKKESFTPGVTSIKLTEHESDAPLSRLSQMNVQHFPQEHDAPEYMWATGDFAVADVNWKGQVVGKKLDHQTWIYVYSKDNPELRDSCLITVVPVLVEGIKIADPEKSIKLTETSTFRVHFTPSDVSVRDIEWSSSDPSVLTAVQSVWIPNEGKITGIKEGTATVTARTPDGKYSASCEVEVTLNGISISPSEIKTLAGRQEVIKATYLNSEMPYMYIDWETADSGVASVVGQPGSSEATLTAVAPGRTTVTATSTKDPTKIAQCVVQVMDITDFMTSGHTGAFVVVNGIARGVGASHITNTGPEDVELTKVTLSDGHGSVLASITDPAQLGILSSGGSKSVDITLRDDWRPVVVWEFTWRGGTYTVTHELFPDK